MNLEVETDMPIIYADKVLDYDDWFAINEDSMIIEFAETGADREMYFDIEAEFEKKYHKYLRDFTKSKRFMYESNRQKTL